MVGRKRMFCVSMDEQPGVGMRLLRFNLKNYKETSSYLTRRCDNQTASISLYKSYRIVVMLQNIRSES